MADITILRNLSKPENQNQKEDTPSSPLLQKFVNETAAKEKQLAEAMARTHENTKASEWTKAQILKGTTEGVGNSNLFFLAVDCISNLTGDKVFSLQVKDKAEKEIYENEKKLEFVWSELEEIKTKTKNPEVKNKITKMQETIGGIVW